MSGTELRNLLGRAYAEQEARTGAPEGLLALCHRKAIPIFVGAPSDGSVFLNSMKLWAMARAGQGEHRLDVDLHLEVFESCAYHVWGQDADAAEAEDRPASLGALVLGGGVPKNFNLQPEPALSQILGFEEIGGYLYDIQITTAPVTDGSLSSCPPAEAVTWGKVDKDAYQRTTESMSADYSMVMPILTKALLDKRAARAAADELGEETLLERHPKLAGICGARRDTASSSGETRSSRRSRPRSAAARPPERPGREAAPRADPERVDAGALRQGTARWAPSAESHARRAREVAGRDPDEGVPVPGGEAERVTRLGHDR